MNALKVILCMNFYLLFVNGKPIEKHIAVDEHLIYVREIHMGYGQPLINTWWRVIHSPTNKPSYTIDVFYNDFHLFHGNQERIEPQRLASSYLGYGLVIGRKSNGNCSLQFNPSLLPSKYRPKGNVEILNFHLKFDGVASTLNYSTVVLHDCDGKGSYSCPGTHKEKEFPWTGVAATFCGFIIIVVMFAAYLNKGQKNAFQNRNRSTVRKVASNNEDPFKKSVWFVPDSRKTKNKKGGNKKVMEEKHVIDITKVTLATVLSNNQISELLENKPPLVSILKRPSEDSIDFKSTKLLLKAPLNDERYANRNFSYENEQNTNEEATGETQLDSISTTSKEDDPSNQDGSSNLDSSNVSNEKEEKDGQYVENVEKSVISSCIEDVPQSLQKIKETKIGSALIGNIAQELELANFKSDEQQQSPTVVEATASFTFEWPEDDNEDEGEFVFKETTIEKSANVIAESTAEINVLAESINEDSAKEKPTASIKKTKIEKSINALAESTVEKYANVVGTTIERSTNDLAKTGECSINSGNTVDEKTVTFRKDSYKASDDYQIANSLPLKKSWIFDIGDRRVTSSLSSS